MSHNPTLLPPFRGRISVRREGEREGERERERERKRERERERERESGYTLAFCRPLLLLRGHHSILMFPVT